MRRRRMERLLAPVSALCLAFATGAWASTAPRMTKPMPIGEPAETAAGKPEALRDVGFDQRLGELVPGDIRLRDEAGGSVAFRDLLRGRPLLLVLAYYQCPMLCTLTLNGTVSALKPVDFTAGREFDVVVVSFDSTETPELAAAKKASYLEHYDRLGTADGWRFLTGEQAEIDRLTAAVGFRYAWDAASNQFAHPSGLMVLTPEGRVARYLFGIDYAPRDVRLALVEATAGKIGDISDKVMLYCYKYDPARGRYGAAVMNLLRAGAALTIVSLGAFIVVARRRERRATASADAKKGSA